MTDKRMTLATAGLVAVLIALANNARAQEFTFRVEHDHRIGSCKGDLIIDRKGVEYRSANKDHARRWAYTDVRLIKLISARKVKILTYEPDKLKLGQDRTFEFKLLSGDVPPALSDFLLARVDRPLSTGFVKSGEDPQYKIPVRHRHTFGGEQGTLKIYPDGVTYVSSRSESSRRWRWGDIQSISRTGPYQFAITTYEPKFGGPTKTFNFDLKARMEDEVYDYLWARVYKVKLPDSAESKH